MKSKKVIIAGVTALAFTVGGGIWSTQSANAASANSLHTTNAVLAAPVGNQQPGLKAGSQGVARGQNQQSLQNQLKPQAQANIQTQLQKYLSIDSATFSKQLKEKPLAEIAKAKGISNEELLQKLIEMLKANQSASGTTMDYTAIAKQMIENQGGFNQGFTQGFPAGEDMIGGGLADLDELADLLDLTVSELKKALQSGDTLAEIADDQDVDVDDVVDLIVSELEDQLEDQLDDGTISEDEYDLRMDSLEDFVTDMVNGE